VRLVSAFDVEDYTGKILDEPARYAASYMFRGRFKLFVARCFFRLCKPLFPGYVWLLCKPTSVGADEISAS